MQARAGSCLGDLIQSSAPCTPAMAPFICNFYDECRVVEGTGCSIRPCQDFDADETSCNEKGCTYSAVERTPEPTEGPTEGTTPTMEPAIDYNTIAPTKPRVVIREECYGSPSSSIISVCESLSSELLCTSFSEVCTYTRGQCTASCSPISSPQECLQAGCSYGEKTEENKFDSESSHGNVQIQFSFTTVAVVFSLAFFYEF